MRLIDVDLLQENLAKEPMENRTYLRANEIVVDSPTAYDVDKVVEEIREYYDNIAELGGNFLPQVVIEIVKGGGLNDGK